MPQNPDLRDASGVPDWQLCGFCGQERERFLDRFVFAPAMRGRGQKSPHELRRKLLQALPRPPDGAQRRIKMPVTKPIRNHALVHFFLLLDFIDKLKTCGEHLPTAGLELLGGLEPPTC